MDTKGDGNRGPILVREDKYPLLGCAPGDPAPPRIMITALVVFYQTTCPGGNRVNCFGARGSRDTRGQSLPSASACSGSGSGYRTADRIKVVPLVSKLEDPL